MPVKKMKRCILRGNTLHSSDDVYDELTKQLSLSHYFGRNLDALWDVLSTDIEGPFEIVWKQASASRKSMGKDFTRMMDVLRRLETVREDFTLTVEQ